MYGANEDGRDAGLALFCAPAFGPGGGGPRDRSAGQIFKDQLAIQHRGKAGRDGQGWNGFRSVPGGWGRGGTGLQGDVGETAGLEADQIVDGAVVLAAEVSVVMDPGSEYLGFYEIPESESDADGGGELLLVIDHGILEENFVDVPAAALPPVVNASFFDIGHGDTIDGAEAGKVVVQSVQEGRAGLTGQQGGCGNQVGLNII